MSRSNKLTEMPSPKRIANWERYWRECLKVVGCPDPDPVSQTDAFDIICNLAADTQRNCNAHRRALKGTVLDPDTVSRQRSGRSVRLKKSDMSHYQQWIYLRDRLHMMKRQVRFAEIRYGSLMNSDWLETLRNITVLWHRYTFTITPVLTYNFLVLRDGESEALAYLGGLAMAVTRTRSERTKLQTVLKHLQKENGASDIRQCLRIEIVRALCAAGLPLVSVSGKQRPVALQECLFDPRKSVLLPDTKTVQFFMNMASKVQAEVYAVGPKVVETRLKTYGDKKTVFTLDRATDFTESVNETVLRNKASSFSSDTRRSSEGNIEQTVLLRREADLYLTTPELEQTFLLLRDGFTAREIALEMNANVRTVEQRISRIRSRIAHSDAAERFED